MNFFYKIKILILSLFFFFIAVMYKMNYYFFYYIKKIIIHLKSVNFKSFDFIRIFKILFKIYIWLHLFFIIFFFKFFLFFFFPKKNFISKFFFGKNFCYFLNYKLIYILFLLYLKICNFYKSIDYFNKINMNFIFYKNYIFFLNKYEFLIFIIKISFWFFFKKIIIFFYKYYLAKKTYFSDFFLYSVFIFVTWLKYRSIFIKIFLGFFSKINFKIINLFILNYRKIEFLFFYFYLSIWNFFEKFFDFFIIIILFFNNKVIFFFLKILGNNFIFKYNNILKKKKNNLHFFNKNFKKCKLFFFEKIKKDILFLEFIIKNNYLISINDFIFILIYFFSKKYDDNFKISYFLFFVSENNYFSRINYLKYKIKKPKKFLFYNNYNFFLFYILNNLFLKFFNKFVSIRKIYNFFFFRKKNFFKFNVKNYKFYEIFFIIKKLLSYFFLLKTNNFIKKLSVFKLIVIYIFYSIIFYIIICLILYLLYFFLYFCFNLTFYLPEFLIYFINIIKFFFNYLNFYFYKSVFFSFDFLKGFTKVSYDIFSYFGENSKYSEGIAKFLAKYIKIMTFFFKYLLIISFKMQNFNWYFCEIIFSFLNNCLFFFIKYFFFFLQSIGLKTSDFLFYFDNFFFLKNLNLKNFFFYSFYFFNDNSTMNMNLNNNFFFENIKIHNNFFFYFDNNFILKKNLINFAETNNWLSFFLCLKKINNLTFFFFNKNFFHLFIHEQKALFQKEIINFFSFVNSFWFLSFFNLNNLSYFSFFIFNLPKILFLFFYKFWFLKNEINFNILLVYVLNFKFWGLAFEYSVNYFFIKIIDILNFLWNIFFFFEYIFFNNKYYIYAKENILFLIKFWSFNFYFFSDIGKIFFILLKNSIDIFILKIEIIFWFFFKQNLILFSYTYSIKYFYINMILFMLENIKIINFFFIFFSFLQKIFQYDIIFDLWQYYKDWLIFWQKILLFYVYVLPIIFLIKYFFLVLLFIVNVVVKIIYFTIIKNLFILLEFFFFIFLHFFYNIFFFLKNDFFNWNNLIFNFENCNLILITFISFYIEIINVIIAWILLLFFNINDGLFFIIEIFLIFYSKIGFPTYWKTFYTATMYISIYNSLLYYLIILNFFWIFKIYGKKIEIFFLPEKYFVFVQNKHLSIEEMWQKYKHEIVKNNKKAALLNFEQYCFMFTIEFYKWLSQKPNHPLSKRLEIETYELEQAEKKLYNLNPFVKLEEDNISYNFFQIKYRLILGNFILYFKKIKLFLKLNFYIFFHFKKQFDFLKELNFLKIKIHLFFLNYKIKFFYTNFLYKKKKNLVKKWFFFYKNVIKRVNYIFILTKLVNFFFLKIEFFLDFVYQLYVNNYYERKNNYFLYIKNYWIFLKSIVLKEKKVLFNFEDIYALNFDFLNKSLDLEKSKLNKIFFYQQINKDVYVSTILENKFIRKKNYLEGLKYKNIKTYQNLLEIYLDEDKFILIELHHNTLQWHAKLGKFYELYNRISKPFLKKEFFFFDLTQFPWETDFLGFITIHNEIAFEEFNFWKHLFINSFTDVFSFHKLKNSNYYYNSFNIENFKEILNNNVNAKVFLKKKLYLYYFQTQIDFLKNINYTDINLKFNFSKKISKNLLSSLDFNKINNVNNYKKILRIRFPFYEINNFNNQITFLKKHYYFNEKSFDSFDFSYFVSPNYYYNASLYSFFYNSTRLEGYKVNRFLKKLIFSIPLWKNFSVFELNEFSLQNYYDYNLSSLVKEDKLEKFFKIAFAKEMVWLYKNEFSENLETDFCDDVIGEDFEKIENIEQLFLKSGNYKFDVFNLLNDFYHLDWLFESWNLIFFVDKFLHFKLNFFYFEKEDWNYFENIWFFFLKKNYEFSKFKNFENSLKKFRFNGVFFRKSIIDLKNFPGDTYIDWMSSDVPKFLNFSFFKILKKIWILENYNKFNLSINYFLMQKNLNNNKLSNNENVITRKIFLSKNKIIITLQKK